MVNAAVPPSCPRCNVANQDQSLFCDNCRLYLRDDSKYVERATYNRRFWGDYVLEVLLFVLTLFIGWFIWMIFTSKTGQTPAKRLLNVYVINVETGQGIGRGDSWLREVVVKGLVVNAIGSVIPFAGVIDAVWIFFDKNRQTLHDKVLKQVIVYAPAGLPQPMQYQANAPVLYQAPPIVPGSIVSPPAGTSTVMSTADELRELGRLRDEGVITADEYEEKRVKLVNRM